MTTNIGAQAADAVNDKLVERQKLEQEMYAHHQDLQTLISQRNENEMVKEELEICEKESSDATIYKQVGPVLLKNDLSDATDTIEKRLELFRVRLKRLRG
ncbi:prefoldin subunit [Skeletonema marinoi]|uniref:Prefoldin subunit n=1 Tax=Skeletonema marinoi TaxID=267567 RepID=A0AAD8Y717_9STRA|nr:prefoldin subunit [Skeletonema marinoi]